MKIEIKKMAKKYMKEVIDLLDKNLSVYSPPFEKYDEIWKIFSSQSNIFAVVAILENKVVGYGALIIEVKIRGGKAGHVEDIVTHENFLKMGVGRSIQEALYIKALEKGCHKIALQCKEHNVSFYEKCNYRISGLGMQKFI